MFNIYSEAMNHISVSSNNTLLFQGIEENLIIKLNQGSKVNIDSLQVKVN